MLNRIFWGIVGALIMPPLEWATGIYERLLPPKLPQVPEYGPRDVAKFRGPRYFTKKYTKGKNA